MRPFIGIPAALDRVVELLLVLGQGFTSLPQAVAEAAERLGVPVCVHGGGQAPGQVPIAIDRFSTRLAKHAITHPVGAMLALTSFTVGGVLVRFPTLRVAFLEAGAGWLPFWLERSDEIRRKTVVHRAHQIRPGDGPPLRLRDGDEVHVSKFPKQRRQFRNVQPSMERGDRGNAVAAGHGKAQVIDMEVDKIEILRLPHGRDLALPDYATTAAAGADLLAAIDQDIELGPLERRIVPTGISIALPMGFEAQVRPRSGLAARNGITVANAPGTIDADYRGEVGVILVNLSREPFRITRGMRIAQLIVARHARAVWREVPALDQTERGAGGFGSTGVAAGSSARRA